MADFPQIKLPSGRLLTYSLSDSPSSSAPIVLLANSLCTDFTLWDRVVSVLNNAGLRTLRFDQPGHGTSGVPDDLSSTTFESIADDVHVLLQSLKLSKIHAWIGVSMGAATGITFVAKYPHVVDRLVACDTISCAASHLGGPDLFGPRVAAAKEAGNLDALLEGTRTRWFGDEWLRANPDEAARVKKSMATTSVDGFETCCAALITPKFDLRPLFGKVGGAVDRALLVVGAKDANLPQTMEEMRKEMQVGFDSKFQVRLEIIPDAGHISYIDGFDRFCEVVIPFLS